jgi:hypothetical protein
MLDDYGFGLALVLRIKADCSRAKTRFHPGYELFFALAALRFRTPCSAASKLQSSLSYSGKRRTAADEVFGNDR